MTDLHGKLERLADRVDDRPAPDLYAARERHQRRRSRSAMAVGLVVAIAAGALVVSALPSSDGGNVASPGPTVAAWAPPDPITLWPESPMTTETPEQAQVRVDAGEDQWRLDPEQVVRRFVGDILGWTEPQVWTTEEGRYEVLPEVCPPNARCYHGIAVDVVQPLGDGIWSVAVITSEPELHIDVPSSDPAMGLTGGSEIAVDVDLAPDRTAHLGMVAVNDCVGIAAAGIALDAGHVTLMIPEAGPDDPTCSDVGAGYLYVYAMDDTTVPEESDPLTQPAAVEFPYLTVVPVYVQMESGETVTATQEPVPSPTEAPTTAPDVIAVSCYGDPSTQLDATVVAAQPDGVHVLVRSTNAYVEVQVDDDFIRVENSPRELVLDLAPGEHGVQCIAPGADQVLDPTPFEVVDPNGYWLDPQIDCSSPSEAIFDAGPVDPGDDIVEALLDSGRSIIRGAIDDPGSFTFGGYPGSPRSRSVVLIDVDGNVLARVHYVNAGDDIWFPSSYEYCEGGADL